MTQNPDQYVSRAEYNKLKEQLSICLQILAEQSFKDLNPKTQNAYYERLGQVISQLES
ncbi:hypothetical protein [Delftia tsuruhatensis]|uniref:hypothetical protein n=1 Tax=Delftia tsuruhatensis TaxID=180282 RepID=UPI0028A1DCF9|nr:hypothetical protein [Delftia tsuruhatensis]